MAKGKHISDKEQYAAYSQQLKRIKNRKARLARHLKKHPDDAQAAYAAQTDGTQRDSSGTKGHFPEKKDFLYDAAGHKTLIEALEPTKREKK